MTRGAWYGLGAQCKERTCKGHYLCKWEARHVREKAMLCGALGNGLLGLRNGLKMGLKNRLKEK